MGSQWVDQFSKWAIEWVDQFSKWVGQKQENAFQSSKVVHLLRIN